MILREGTLRDAPLLARMFRQMWLDNGVAAEQIVPDWEARVLSFVEQGQQRDGLRLFFAQAADRAIGCAACQRFSGLYPDLLQPDTRRYGYIWGVYVAPAARRAGVGAELTARCMQALREAGCSYALLHAAPMGQRVYERLGFAPTNELRVAL